MESRGILFLAAILMLISALMVAGLLAWSNWHSAKPDPDNSAQQPQAPGNDKQPRLPGDKPAPEPGSWVWQKLGHVAATDLTDVAFSGTAYVAVGKDGVTWSSTDGVNWVARDSGTLSDLHCVVWNGSFFLAGGSNAGVFKSFNGVDWVKQQPGSGLQSIVWANGRFHGVAGGWVYFFFLGRQSMGRPTCGGKLRGVFNQDYLNRQPVYCPGRLLL